MYTSLWGRHAWLFLHSIIYQRDATDVEWKPEVVEKFLLALGYFLPCPGCKAHYDENKLSVSPNYKEASRSIEQLEKYFLAVHNAVNFSYNLPQVTLEQARELHKNVDWFKNFCYFFKAISIQYKDPLPEEYETLAQLETIKERVAFLDEYKIKYQNNSQKMKQYFSLLHHCTRNTYVQLLEMTDEEKEKKVAELKKKKSRELSSVKEFIRLKIDRKKHFETQKKWHWQERITCTRMHDFLKGLMLLFPGKVERETLVKIVQQDTFSIEPATQSHDNLKYWFCRTLNEINRIKGLQWFNISPCNSKEEQEEVNNTIQVHKKILTLEQTIGKLQKSSDSPRKKEMVQKLLLQKERLEGQIPTTIPVNESTLRTASSSETVIKSGEHSNETMYVYEHRDFMKIMNAFGTENMGKDYGNAEHHASYVKIVQEHVKKNGRVTYPGLSKEYKKIKEKKVLKRKLAGEKINRNLRRLFLQKKSQAKV